MSNRQLLGDLSLAVLIALPLVSLVRPSPVHNRQVLIPVAAKAATADPLSGNRRMSLF